MINYDEMASCFELTPRRGYQARQSLNEQQSVDLSPSYPTSLLQLIKLVGDLRNQGIQITSLAGGLPPNEPLEELWKEYYPEAAQYLADNVPVFEGMQYGGADGNMRLRNVLAKKATELSSIKVNEKEVITTPSSQLALSETLMAFCAVEGKVALTSSPTYSAFLEAAAVPLEVPVIGVDSDDQGMIPESLEKTIKLLQENGIEIGLTYGMVFGNPTGFAMSDERGKDLNEICKKYKIPFMVDYAYDGLAIDMKENEIPRVSYMDENVIYTSTGSKSYAPGSRQGWMIAKGKEIHDKLLVTKQAQMILSNPQAELFFWHYIESKMMDERMPVIVARYKEGIEAGLNAVEMNSDVLRCGKPKAGMFLWVEVPEGISTQEALPEILNKNRIAYSPGEWFMPIQVKLPDGTIVGPPQKNNMMRLCVVTEDPKKVEEAINQLAIAFRIIATEKGIDLFKKTHSDGNQDLQQVVFSL